MNSVSGHNTPFNRPTLQRFTVILLRTFFFYCSKEVAQEEPTLAPPNNTSVHLTMGNPSGATLDVANPFNYLMVKPSMLFLTIRIEAHLTGSVGTLIKAG